jgi:peptidoglycan/LPS O-acetylase OafA/YrhL
MARLHFSFIFLTIISFALCIYTFSINSSGLFGKLLLSKPLKALGQRSYSIYMLQMIIVGVFTNIFEYLLKFNLNSALGYRSIVINILIIMVTIGLSKYTYSYIEVFFINKSRLIANKYMN